MEKESFAPKYKKIIAVVAIIIIAVLAIALLPRIMYSETKAGGYPAVSLNVEAVGDNQIRLDVLAGSIAAGQWAYSVSTTVGTYNWVTATVALIAPSVSLGSYPPGTYYVNVKQIPTGHVYFSYDQSITVPAS